MRVLLPAQEGKKQMSRTAIALLVAALILGLLLCCCLGAAAVFSVRRYGGGGPLSSMGSWRLGQREVVRDMQHDFRVESPATLVVSSEVGQV